MTFLQMVLNNFCFVICHDCLVKLECHMNKKAERKKKSKMGLKKNRNFKTLSTTDAGLTLQVCDILLRQY